MDSKKKDIPKLFRVILPVNNVDVAASFYENLLSLKGKRVSSVRHYFDCNGTILACFDPRAYGDDFDLKPNPDHLYFSVNDLEAVFDRAVLIGAKILSPIGKRPWGNAHSTCRTLLATKSALLTIKRSFLVKKLEEKSPSEVSAFYNYGLKVIIQPLETINEQMIFPPHRVKARIVW